MLVVSIVGILSVLATPLFLSYYQGSRLRVAAEQVAASVNQGRQLGIRGNAGACVHINPTALQYRLGSCAAAAVCGPVPALPCIWVGPGTDAAGNINAPQGITLTTTGDPLFSYLGAANPGGTITVTNAQTGSTLRVVVAGSGRVCIAPTAGCP